jgi:UDP-N-acetylglucosamine 4,6-dehydratase
MSCLLGDNRDILFPKLSEKLHLTTFAEIAVKYLESLGYEPHLCATEDEARGRAEELIATKRWPCYFFDSDTTGEKDFEEFFTADESLDMDRFESIGVIRNEPVFDAQYLDHFVTRIGELKAAGSGTRRIWWPFSTR